MTVNGMTLAYGAAGGLLLWSGIAGTSISATVRGVLAGKSPSQLPDTEPIITDTASSPSTASGGSAPAGNTGAATATAGANQAIAKILAAPYGWATGADWTGLLSLWNRESGWSNTAANPQSGAYGIAQALGHGTSGTAGTVTNEYGGYGVSDGVAQAANSGSASAQITWGLAYIKQTYGSPAAAWAHEVAAGSY